MVLVIGVQSQLESYQRMVLDAALLSTWHSKVMIKSKVEQSGQSSSAPLHLGVVAIGRGAFGSPPTTVANFTQSGSMA